MILFVCVLFVYLKSARFYFMDIDIPNSANCLFVLFVAVLRDFIWFVCFKFWNLLHLLLDVDGFILFFFFFLQNCSYFLCLPSDLISCKHSINPFIIPLWNIGKFGSYNKNSHCFDLVLNVLFIQDHHFFLNSQVNIKSPNSWSIFYSLQRVFWQRNKINAW